MRSSDIAPRSKVLTETYFNKKLFFNQIKQDLCTPPVISEAEKHRKAHSLYYNLSGEKTFCEIMKSETWIIAETSLGTALHFTLLKQLILMMSLISLISIFPMVINCQGDYYRSNERQSKLDQLTIGNSFGQRNHSNKTRTSSEIKKSYNYIWVSDLCYSLLFLLFILSFFLYTRRSIDKYYKADPKVSDYAIEIRNLPKGNLNLNELKNYFETENKTVHSIGVSRKFGKIIRLFMQKEKIDRKILICQTSIEFMDSISKKGKDHEKLKKKITNLEKNLKKCEKKIKKCKKIKSLEDFKIKKAFVVFDSIEDKKSCLKTYTKELCGEFFRIQRRNQLKYAQDGLEYQIEIRPTEEPEDIIWENLEYNTKNKLLRVFISYFVTISIFIFTFIIVYNVKTAQSRLPTDQSCRDYDPSIKGNSESSSQRLCYCRGLDGYSVLGESDNCSKYLHYLSEAFGYKFLGAFGITFINFILRAVIKIFTNFEKTDIKSKIYRRVFLKTFVIVFINTSILTFLVNLKIKNFSEFVFQGEFDDFDREWFLSVGNTILVTMLVALASPHLFYFVIFYPYYKIKRWHLKKWPPTTQYEMNKSFIGPKFDLPGRTAQVVSVLFTCFLYSGGIPILNFVCLAFLVIIYFSDKYLIYNHYRKPSKCNDLMYFSVIKILPFAVVIHSCFSMFTYGCPGIFDVQSPYVESFRGSFNENFAFRLGRTSGVANLFLIFFSIFLFIVIVLVDSCCIRKLLKFLNQKIDDGGKKRIAEVFKNGQIIGYDISDNPNYEVIINEMKRELIIPIKVKNEKLEKFKDYSANATIENSDYFFNESSLCT